jgi:hypothetical protein
VDMKKWPRRRWVGAHNMEHIHSRAIGGHNHIVDPLAPVLRSIEPS